MDLCLINIGIKIDKLLLKIYSKTKLKIFKIHLYKRTVFHVKMIKK